jgi:outer membrane immunogenic protein
LSATGNSIDLEINEVIRNARYSCVVAVLVTVLCGAGFAQQQPQLPATGQIGNSLVSLSAIEVLTSNSNRTLSGTGQQDKPTAAGGIQASYQHYFNMHSSFLVNYGYTKNAQKYFDGFNVNRQKAGVHEATVAYMFSVPMTDTLTPFIFVGGGGLFFRPALKNNDNIVDAVSQSEAAILAGGGLDVKISSKFGLRLQYRALIYKAPDFGLTYLSTGQNARISEPAIGLTYRF